MNKTKNIKLNSIISVYDGDTFRGSINALPKWIGSNIPFRIRGIDTPEIRGVSQRVKRTGIEARDTVRAMLSFAKDIRVDVYGTDKYGRFLVDLRVDGIDVGDALIKNELAVSYDGGTKQKW